MKRPVVKQRVSWKVYGTVQNITSQQNTIIERVENLNFKYLKF